MSLSPLLSSWTPTALLLAPLTWTTAVPAPLQTPLPPGQGIPPGQGVQICNAGDARTNTAAPPYLVGVYDRVPVTPAGDVGFFVAYSARNVDATPGSPIYNNVSMFLFELVETPAGRSEVLIFGSGYGDHNLATNSAAFDAVTVDKCIRRCMRLTAAETDLRFVVPHGHADHINPAFVAAMRVLGYGVRDITFHVGDQGLVDAMGWTPADTNVFRVLTQTGTCAELAQANEGTGQFDTTLGPLWFFRRPGHTPGSIDGVLESDVNGYRTLVIVRGSQPNGQCSTFPPTAGFDSTFTVLAHDNVIAPTLP